MSPLLLGGTGAVGLALIIFGQQIARRQSDPVADRLTQLGTHVRSLEELDLQQPFTERILRPLIRWLASALGRFQERRARTAAAPAPEQGPEAIRRKLALAGNPYHWTPADYL